MVTYLGSLVQLCCGEGGTLQTNITGMCGECLQCLGHTGFALAHGMCSFPVYTAQAPGYSAGELSKVGPGLHALPRSKPLRFRFSSTPKRHRFGWACILCPSQVQVAQVTRFLATELSQADCASYHLPGPSRLVSWVHSKSTVSDVPYVSSLELISGCNPLEDLNRPGSQEDLFSNWEPAPSSVEDAVSGAEIAPHLLALAVACLPLCLWQGEGLVCSRIALLCYSLSPLFCEQVSSALG